MKLYYIAYLTIPFLIFYGLNLLQTEPTDNLYDLYSVEDE